MEESAFFAERASQGGLIVKDPPKFDLESYISNYAGRTRLDRLALIGSTSTFLAADATRMAIREAKQGSDVNFYMRMARALNTMLPDDPLGLMDMDWVEKKTQVLKVQTDRLEAELKQYKNNLIKESIRMGYEDLGDYHFSTGDYQEAYRAYFRMRESCTSGKHNADMSFKLVLVSISQRSWLTVQSQIVNTKSQPLKTEEHAKMDPIISACTGLAQMSSGQYREAALSFLRTSYNFITSDKVAGIQFQKEVLTGNDIAVYGGLCALASMDRNELQKHVLENPEFRQFLELEPHIRRAISLFCSSKYSACLELLELYRNDYLLDLYLQPCLQELYGQVRSKSIVQFFIPFSCVTLEEMGRAFQSSSKVSIEDELTSMIQNGALNARIDLVDKLLIAPRTQARHGLHESAMDMASSYERTLRLRLLRLHMQIDGLAVKAPRHHHSQMQANSANDLHESYGGELASPLESPAVGGGPGVGTVAAGGGSGAGGGGGGKRERGLRLGGMV